MSGPSVSVISPPTPFIMKLPPTTEGIRSLLHLGTAAFCDVGTGANDVAAGNHTHPDLDLLGNVYTKIEVDDIIDGLEPIYLNIDELIDGGEF